MIFRLSVSILFFFLVFTLEAQEVPRLNVPVSPAFSILDFEPAAVMRPSNARDLAADVLNSFDKEGKLVLNSGLEVAPYWLVSHPKLTRSTYLNPNPGQAFLQSLSLSAATVKDSASGRNKLGAGFRFRLFNGKPLEEKLKLVADELSAKNTILDVINGARIVAGSAITSRRQAIDVIAENLKLAGINEDTITSVKEQAGAVKENYTDTPADIRSFLEFLINCRREVESELLRNKSDLLYQRKGFILEFAGASGFNAIAGNSIEKTGLWANASYYVSPDNLFTLTARYMNRNKDTVLTNLDAGLGFLQKTDKYNIAVEGMFRWYRAEIPDKNLNNEPITRLAREFTYRLAIQCSYTISKDLSVNLNLGKDFSSPFLGGSGFFSILGLNYSIISRKPLELN